MSDADEQLIDVARSDTIDIERLRHLEEINEASKFVSIGVITKRLEQKKITMLAEEPIRVIELFTRLDRRLMRPDLQ